MSKSKFKEIDNKEQKRTDELDYQLAVGKRVSGAKLFASELIPKILMEKPRVFLQCLDQANLPINCLLYPHVYGIIYVNCPSASNPQQLKPYLERGQILPILASPLSSYKTAFSDLITQYPYVSCYMLALLRFYNETDYDKNGGLCEDHFALEKKSLFKDLSLKVRNKERFQALKYVLNNCFFPYLYPPFDVEARTIFELHDEIKKNRLNAIMPFVEKAEILSMLRSSQAFNARPQTNADDLTNIQHTLESLNCNGILELDKQFLTKEWMANSIGIDYNYNIPIEDYLDRIIPRKAKINNLLNKIASKESKRVSIRGINDEIWKINSEISNSKAIDTWTFFVNITENNWKIILGLLLGGLIGYSSGNYAGCSIGSSIGVASGIANRIAEKKNILKISHYPQKTIEWIKEKVENQEEKLTAKILSKDLRTIQVWNLRRKIYKT